ncbi:histone deacetylase 14 [Artemisia annua]|uniref:Histone deacetylase 14 n=1 Tax=Artemisia annua TaxID=35608 RepID=A0A2U1M9C6_ARTAN|nr:histone deacetylase 14 [Artemisia annua]
MIVRAGRAKLKLSYQNELTFGGVLRRVPKLEPLPKVVYSATPAFRHNNASPKMDERISCILSSLKKAKLTPKFRESEIIQLENIRSATMEDISSVHSTSYISSREQTIEESMVDVGTCLSVVDNVVEAAKSTAIPPIGFALIRPGESHLFNTIAIAARYVQRVHRLKRVLIIDFDVCYGCQTSSTFYDDPDVLYLSTHELGAFPNIEGLIENIGHGSGEGTTINVELPDLTGDVAMRNVFDEVIEPAAKRFEPDIILVSAGLHNPNQFVPLECRNLNEPLTTIDFLLHICDSFEFSEVEKYLLFVIQTGFTLGRVKLGQIKPSYKWIEGKEVEGN